uniref:Uncharacterized protein n=1 Tax=Strongyloides venezuelensis TaxID=75913 RepID=A0A0K0EZ62_STRVS
MKIITFIILFFIYPIVSPCSYRDYDVISRYRFRGYMRCLHAKDTFLPYQIHLIITNPIKNESFLVASTIVSPNTGEFIISGRCMYVSGNDVEYLPYLIIGPSSKKFLPKIKNIQQVTSSEFSKERSYYLGKSESKHNENNIKKLSSDETKTFFNEAGEIKKLSTHDSLNSRTIKLQENDMKDLCAIDYYQFKFPNDITTISNNGIYVLFNLFVYKNQIYNPFEKLKTLHGIHMTKKLNEATNHPIRLDSFNEYISKLKIKYS